MISTAINHIQSNDNSSYRDLHKLNVSTQKNLHNYSSYYGSLIV